MTEVAHYPEVLQNGTKQIALGYNRTHRCRTHCPTCRRHQAQYGFATWKAAPHGKIMKSDVSVSKNYLNEQDLKELERIVSMYLYYAENQAKRQIAMKMQDWVDKLDAFLNFNDYQILKDAGKMSAEVAKKLAEKEYEKFAPIQDRNFESDFDKAIKKLKKG
jgi:hypothetical protein